MKIGRELQGEGFILSSSLLWGLFPVITVLSLRSVSPLISLALSAFFASLFFGLVLTIKGKWHEIVNRSALSDILLATFFIGVLYYVFYFFGLQHTSPGNASIVALTEIFFSFLLFHVFRKDYLPRIHIVGATLMVLGALIVLYPNIHGVHIGDFLVLLAAVCAPFGNFFQQRARTKTGSESILFIRSLVSSLAIFLLAFCFHNPFSFGSLQNLWLVIALNGICLLGLSKFLWIEGIHRISVTKAVALESGSPLITLLFAWLLIGTHPTLFQLISFIPLFFGILLLSQKGKKEELQQGAGIE